MMHILVRSQFSKQAYQDMQYDFSHCTPISQIISSNEDTPAPAPANLFYSPKPNKKKKEKGMGERKKII